MIDTKPIQERAVLVGLVNRIQDETRLNEFLDELSFLVDTAGGIVAARFSQKLVGPDPRTYVGMGKLNEIARFVASENIDFAVFDDDLTPSQIRNIEATLKCRVLDRSNLILDIFVRRARTAHARTQVELAQYQYLLPRLAGMWKHLERQRGGIGLRGPGEREIETDRRIIRDKISLLRKKLAAIERQKITQRKSRGDMVRVALVGYTNVGKSTIMNLLCKSNVFVEDKLFATLDTTVRKVAWMNIPFLLSDTVGFIRKLPNDLIESFKSTLDEVREADILLHVVDISHHDFEEHIQVVRQTLSEIGIFNKPVIIVFNKTDAYRFVVKDADDLTPPVKENMNLEELQKTWMMRENLPCVFISALHKTHIHELRALIISEVKKIYQVRYPFRAEFW